MTGTLNLDPRLREQLLSLVDDHRELRDEPLHLALVYNPGRDHGDVFLFEVVSNVFDEVFSPTTEFFEVTYGSSEGFPMPPAQRLHLVLTTPREFRRAMKEEWFSARELRDAVRRGDYEPLYQDEHGSRLMEELAHG